MKPKHKTVWVREFKDTGLLEIGVLYVDKGYWYMDAGHAIYVLHVNLNNWKYVGKL